MLFLLFCCGLVGTLAAPAPLLSSPQEHADLEEHLFRVISEGAATATDDAVSVLLAATATSALLPSLSLSRTAPSPCATAGTLPVHRCTSTRRACLALPVVGFT